MSSKGGGKEGVSQDSSVSVPGEQKMASESNKQKISRMHETYQMISKENIAKILQYYDDDEHEATDAITRDGGCEALKNWADSMNSKTKNTKNKKKKKKGKKETSLGSSATASFDADDSSSLHSSGNVDGEIEKDCLLAENNNVDSLPDVTDSNQLPLDERINYVEADDASLTSEAVPVIAGCGDTSAEKSAPEGPRSVHQGTDKPVSASPTSEGSDRRDDVKFDKYRSVKEEGRYMSRQRTNSSRRSKTTSLSEDSSSQHNQQAAAAPTKRGFEKCKKDLNKQSIYLQRIHSQLDKGLEESSKKLEKVFNDLRKLLDQRQQKLESELAKSKEEALNLLKSRQDLAIDLKRRVDRTPSLTEAEWTELRSDVKQFVTERKYDDELGKTIWFQWSMNEITEQIETFGEVSPVKNVYSQRSHSALSNVTVSQSHPEPSPSSSLANEDISSATDRNDVADILATDEGTAAGKKQDANPPVQRNQGPENRARVFSNTKYHNRGRANYRGNRGYQRNPRSNNQSNYRNNNYVSYENYDSRNTYQDREVRYHSNNAYSNDRNMNPNRIPYRNDRKGQNMNYHRSNQGGRSQGNTGPPHQSDNVAKPEAAPKENSSTVGSEQANVVNGYVK